MVIKKGSKFKCKKRITNVLGWPLFIKGQVYEVLNYVDNDEIVLNHVLYANEYQPVTKEYIFNYFDEVKG